MLLRSSEAKKCNYQLIKYREENFYRETPYKTWNHLINSISYNNFYLQQIVYSEIFLLSCTSIIYLSASNKIHISIFNSGFTQQFFCQEVIQIYLSNCLKMFRCKSEEDIFKLICELSFQISIIRNNVKFATEVNDILRCSI